MLTSPDSTPPRSICPALARPVPLVTLTFALFLSLSLAFALPLAFALSLSLALALPLAFALSLSLALALAFALPLALSLTRAESGLCQRKRCRRLGERRLGDLGLLLRLRGIARIGLGGCIRKRFLRCLQGRLSPKRQGAFPSGCEWADLLICRL